MFFIFLDKGFVNGSPLAIKAGKVVAGLDAEATNQMLQLLGRFVLNRKESALAVRKVLKGEKPTSAGETKKPAESTKLIPSTKNAAQKSSTPTSRPTPSVSVRKMSTITPSSLKKPSGPSSTLSRRPSNASPTLKAKEVKNARKTLDSESINQNKSVPKKSPRASPVSSGNRTRPSSRSGSASLRPSLHRPGINPVDDSAQPIALNELDSNFADHALISRDDPKSTFDPLHKKDFGQEWTDINANAIFVEKREAKEPEGNSTPLATEADSSLDVSIKEEGKWFCTREIFSSKWISLFQFANHKDKFVHFFGSHL